MSKRKKRSKRITPVSPTNPLWIESLATAAKLARPNAECTMRTRLNFDMRSGRPSVFVPPDMAELQPASLRYLNNFARQHELMLVEDRRRVEVHPSIEKRDKLAPMIATGISLLMKQTGLPGIAKPLSNPHRLNANSPCIPIPRLIRMAAHAVNSCKRVVVLPNRMMVRVLDNDTRPIAGYACKIRSNAGNTILCHFDSSNLRAIGYSTGEQFVMHVCLAGGPLQMPSLWTNFHTLAQTDFQFQLFPSKQAASDFGLLFATYYMDMAQASKPWWLSKDYRNRQPNARNDDTALQQKAS